MKQGKVFPVPQSQNPIKQLQTRLKQLESAFKLWLSSQSLPVEAAVVTTTSAARGAAVGAFMSILNPQAIASLNQAQAISGGPLVQARNFAAWAGMNVGISCILKRLKGKEDVQSW